MLRLTAVLVACLALGVASSAQQGGAELPDVLESEYQAGWLVVALDRLGVALDDELAVTLLLPSPPAGNLTALEEAASNLPLEELEAAVLRFVVPAVFPSVSEMADVGNLTSAANTTITVTSTERTAEAIIESPEGPAMTYTVDLIANKLGQSVVYRVERIPVAIGTVPDDVLPEHCPEGTQVCNGICSDLLQSEAACGECGTVCTDLEFCSDGACTVFS